MGGAYRTALAQRRKKMIRFKEDIFEILKSTGYSTYRIQKEKIFPGSTIQKFKKESLEFNLTTLDRLCRITGLQPGELIEYHEE